MTTSYIPTELYTIYVYDHSAVLQLILQDWNRVSFTQRVNSAWNHQITLEFGYDSPDLEVLRNIKDDWIFIIYRVDPVTLISSKVYEGLHQTIVDQVRENGGIILNLYGVGYTQLLSRRIIVPPTGLEYNEKTNFAETVLKGYVNDCMISPEDTNRVFPGMTAAADLGRGNEITYSARYTNLLSVCETVSEQGDLDFGIYGTDTIGQFIFDARDIWGNDFREDNLAGNTPIIFSIERDNMLIPILSINNSAEQNYAYVGGEGQGTARIIEEVYDFTAVNRTPWSRKEVFVEARDQADSSALVAAGLAELQQRRSTEKLSFSVIQTDSSRWIRDWNLGDLVSARYYTYIFDKQITEIKVDVTPDSAEKVTVGLEDIRI